MTTTNINSAPIRFQNGGRLLIADSTNLLNVLNIAENGGAIRIKPGSREVLPYKDRGILQVPLEGDQMPAEIEFNLKLASALTSKDLLIYLRTSPGTGLKPTFKIWVEQPDYRGATAGWEWGFLACVIDPDSIEISAGDKFDSVKFKAMDYEAPTDPVRFASLRTTTT